MKNFFRLALLAAVLFIGNSQTMLAQGPPPPPPGIDLFDDGCYTFDDGVNVWKQSFNETQASNVDLQIRTRKLYRSKFGSAFVLLQTETYPATYSGMIDWNTDNNTYKNDSNYSYSLGECSL